MNDFAPGVIPANAGIQRVTLSLQNSAGNLKPLSSTTLDPRVRGDDNFRTERVWVVGRGAQAWQTRKKIRRLTTTAVTDRGYNLTTSKTHPPIRDGASTGSRHRGSAARS